MEWVSGLGPEEVGLEKRGEKGREGRREWWASFDLSTGDEQLLAEYQRGCVYLERVVR